jgi:diguanylate cyclase (GGDEF)-like protein
MDILNSALILIIITSFKFSFRVNCWIAFLLGASALSYAVASNIPVANIFTFIIGCGVIPIVGYYVTSFSRLREKDYAFRLQEMQQRNLNIKRQTEGIIDLNKRLEKDAQEITMLYEASKSLSITLDWDKMCETSAELLKDMFRFRRFRLVLLKDENGESTIENIFLYSFHKDFEEKVKLISLKDIPKSQYKSLMYLKNILLQQRQFIYVTWKDENASDFGLSTDARSMFAIPIFTENKLAGVFIIEDLNESEIERFQIFISELSLVIRKIRLYKQIQKLAITDSLTGLYLRRHFLELLDSELKRAEKHKHSLPILMLDLDFFKKCNDSYGHLVGDNVLREIANIIKANIREIDVAARYGGEEFIIALPETDLKGACLVSERIRQHIEKRTFKAYDEKVKMTVSIGISIFPDLATSIDELIEHSDAALYSAKQAGRNRVCVYGQK